MKVHLKIPGGGEFHYEKEPRKPMDEERFDAIFTAVLVLGALFILYGIPCILMFLSA